MISMICMMYIDYRFFLIFVSLYIFNAYIKRKFTLYKIYLYSIDNEGLLLYIVIKY